MSKTSVEVDQDIVRRLPPSSELGVFARWTKPTVAAAFSPLAAEGLVGLSAPVAFELGCAARSPSDFRALRSRRPMPTTVERWTSTLRSPNAADVGPCPSWTRWSLLPPRARGLVVLHYDADFELVAEITGQPHEWVVARGTLD